MDTTARPAEPVGHLCRECGSIIATYGCPMGHRSLTGRTLVATRDTRPEWVRRAQAGHLPAKDLSRMA